MFKFYRKKEGGLCYKVVAWNALAWDGDPLPAPQEQMIVIQHQNGTPYYMPAAKFWDEFEGVEDEDIPPAYREDV